ncbi:EamA family transporter [Paraburkholderia caballeronis]|uniref:Small Multidrug Resistance protein n=1 Tax=Paraburkholderia caballeronis TaxID=416943 RepID=A0A1H7JUD3_9BURK|nr:small multidrug resistance protein [Paraburkholderia caballeronis]PXW27267.1 Small Multidrug Resistance (SMR) protein [Paraburkholderia caballeronis]PXX02741.1 Small Multidrug Resistance (SMR) protein [Paraburkholderia caballeronis]RAK03466.1 Small Multidrug Resistance (SMR) protein [Paraburkholderia caballeronis]SEC39112.1 Small Multidrug Resistance protein [Paraburkholderia caballeronis]SEK78132.1 Small Multidrug Resistance protein [Paraburkholderia caballeronis]
MNWALIVASGAFGGLASVLLRVAASQGTAEWPWAFRFGAIGAYGIGFVLYAIALRKANLSVAYPLMVAVSILVVLAFTALHEHLLQPPQVAGALIILVGVWMVTRSA